MTNDIAARLLSFGYTLVPADNWLVDYLIEKVTNTIQNECNITGIPDGLHHVAVDMVCGEFLSAKKNSGQELTGFDLNQAVKQIRVGDTTTTYAVGDTLPGIDFLIDYLLNYGRPQLLRFRRLAW